MVILGNPLGEIHHIVFFVELFLCSWIVFWLVMILGLLRLRSRWYL